MGCSLIKRRSLCVSSEEILKVKLGAMDPEAQIMDSPGECTICCEMYKNPSRSRAPRTLQCGHSLCLHCLRRLVCHSLLLTFVVCPFCRNVTVIPEEGVQALKTDEATLRRASMATVVSNVDVQSESSGCSSGRNSPSLSEDHMQSPRPSIFTVSEVIVPDEGRLWGGRYRQEIRSTYLLGIARRVALSEAHPSPPPTSISADRVRLCIALGLVLLLGFIFFMLLFFK